LLLDISNRSYLNIGVKNTFARVQTEDFTLIDMAGDIYRGRDGWQGYFSAYPKYKIRVQAVLTSNNGVAIIGKTTGSHVPPMWRQKRLFFGLLRSGIVMLPNGGHIAVSRKPRRKHRRKSSEKR
jgi:hypothetical protein